MSKYTDATYKFRGWTKAQLVSECQLLRQRVADLESEALRISNAHSELSNIIAGNGWMTKKEINEIFQKNLKSGELND